MSNFTVNEVAEDFEEWSNDHGTFRTYDIEAAGPQGSGFFQTTRKADSPAPTVGEVMDAEIVRKGPGPAKLKRIYQPNPQSPSGSPQRASGGKSPGESNRISRMNAHARAMELLKLQIEVGSKTVEDLRDKSFATLVLPLIEAFYQDSKKAGEEG